jgi:hypothetical protein
MKILHEPVTINKMTFNDDLVGLVVSYLDITEYNPDEQTTILSSFEVVDHDKVLAVWWKNSNVEIARQELYTTIKVNGRMHNENGPAVKWVGGTNEWWFHGKKHRVDRPAIESANGDKAWYVDGKLHRIDEPAIEFANGTKEWWVDGKLHRDDGPAIITARGRREWWVNGERHRDDGPAIEWPNGGKAWYLDGQQYY